MGQRSWAIALSVFVLVFILGLNINKNSKTVLLASNFALYDILTHIAPEDTNVEMLIPFGQDSHTFIPSPKKIASIHEAKHFFYVSQGMDAWVKNSQHLQNKHNAIDLSEDFLWLEGHEEAEHHQAEHHTFDPHYWLSIDNQRKALNRIASTLKKLFPKNESIASKQKQYEKSLLELKQRYKSTLSECKQETLYVTHDAFSYLEHDYGFKTHSILGLSPESSPSALAVKQVIESLETDNVKTIFFESFISDKLALTIAREVGLKVDVLDALATISTAEAGRKISYVDLMQSNLSKISKALECR